MSALCVTLSVLGLIALLCALEAFARFVDKRRPNMYARRNHRRVIDRIGGDGR